MMSMLCNYRVRELLILARTWFAFGLPSKTGCDRLTVEVFCFLATPDSLVAHRTCPVRSDFAGLTSDFCTMCFFYSRSRPLSAGDRCSVGSPDSPVNYSGAPPQET
jgi:hypothetical protein